MLPPQLCTKHGSNAALLLHVSTLHTLFYPCLAAQHSARLLSFSSSLYPAQLQIVHSNRRGGAAHRSAPRCSRDGVEQDASSPRSSKVVKTCLQKSPSNRRSQKLCLLFLQTLFPPTHTAPAHRRGKRLGHNLIRSRGLISHYLGPRPICTSSVCQKTTLAFAPFFACRQARRLHLGKKRAGRLQLAKVQLNAGNGWVKHWSNSTRHLKRNALVLILG
jgi:hypothetical protein